MGVLAVPLLLAPGITLGRLVDRANAQPTTPVDRPLTGNTRVLAADGSLIAQFYEHDRTLVTSVQIAPVVKQALIDIEDSRFYQHGALDPKGIARAVVTDLRSGGNAQGGSTLTQQLVKQTLVQNATTPEQQQAAVADSLARKLVEARYATELQGEFTKDEILTRYLNTVYFGAGAYGLESAAQTYFSTDAAHLTLAQAATLAGLVQNPSALNPIDHPQAAQERRDQVLTRMHDLGHISAQDLVATTAQPVTVRPGGTANGCAGAALGGFFCDYLQDHLTGTLGLTPDQLRNGGLTIRTTLRPDLQRAGDQAVVATLPMDSSLAAIYTVVEPGTGAVLAMSDNRRFGCTGTGCTSVDLNVAAAAGAGSTYKLFTAASAMEQGYTMDFTQTTSNPYYSRVFEQNGGRVGAPYSVENATDHYPATLDMAEALVRSSNTYFVALEDSLGSVAGPVRTAQQLGLSSLTDDLAHQFTSAELGSFTLGPIATSPLALATAYATVFSGGTRCDPTPVIAILTPDGTPLTGPDGTPVDTGTHCTPGVLPAGIADTLTQVLRGDVESSIGTATRAAVPGHQIAGKTGTTQDHHSVAFVGSTPQYTASVMVENPDTAQDVGGYGGDKGAQIWHDAMQPILTDEPVRAFPPADPAHLGRLADRSGGTCTAQVGDLQIPCS
ncbi:penicillin-binding protein [Geodermatophilus sp. TF02-6]|nr:penicillin-binding protein [Geodermatophilus sp. TF02-6]